MFFFDLFLFAGVFLLLLNALKMDPGFVLLKSIMFIFKIFVLPVTRILAFFEGRKMCPPTKDPVLFYSAKQLASMIRTRQITSKQVINAYIARINEVNPVVNAVVQDRFAQALLDADAVDKLIQANSKSEQELRTETPLLGVPITVKESIAVEGMSNAAGSKTPRAASVDAEIVHLVRQAGAIPIVVTNTPELCMFWETYNNVTGRTLNPYDSRRTTAGSSGGEAALLGSGASVLGLGSDIGGSLRLPAMFTGVYGHKPTPGMVSLDGHVPGCSDKKWLKYFATGPMVRYAEDLPLLLSVVTRPEHRNALRLDEKVSIKDIKLFYMENSSDSYFATKIDNDIVQAIRTIVVQFEKQHGVVATKAALKKMKHCFSMSVPVLLAIDHVETPFYNETTETFSVWHQLWRFITFRSNIIFPVLFYGIMKQFSLAYFTSINAKCEQRCDVFKKEFENLLGDNGVFLFPLFPNAAHLHHNMYYKFLDIGYMSIWNALRMPVTSCPVGLNSKGLPIGIQIVTKPGNDRLGLAVAKEIENIFGGWKPPFEEIVTS